MWDFEEKEIERKHQELVELAEREPLTAVDEKRNYETLKRVDQAIFEAFKATAQVEEEEISVLDKVDVPVESQPVVMASTLRADSIVAAANDEVSQQSVSSVSGKKKRKRKQG